MDHDRLVKIKGPQQNDVWPLSRTRPTVLGRSSPDAPTPDIDLWPDFRVSRPHARIWFEADDWWIEDSDSLHGTFVGNTQIQGQGPTRLEPRTEIRIGDTIVMCAPHHWHRLRRSELVVDVEVTPVINLALARCGCPLISRLVVRNWGTITLASQPLQIALPPYVHMEAVTVPALAPGQFLELTVPPPQFDDDAFERRNEKSLCQLSIRLRDGVLRGEAVEVWVLAANEWACEPRYPLHLSLAAFVLPNHPLISHVTAAACGHLSVEHEAEEALQAIYGYLLREWTLRYRFEPPSWERFSQKIRLPHRVFLNVPGQQGQGTCIDLALCIAACLEHFHDQPLIALLDLGDCWHALVGSWLSPKESLEPVLYERQRIMTGAVWVDPNGCTRDLEYECPFPRAQAEAQHMLATERFLCAIDVAAARTIGRVDPLPFAGEPVWSPEVQAIIEQSHGIGRHVRQPIGTVALLIALLRTGQGLTFDLFRACGRQPVKDADSLWGQLKLSPEKAEAEPRSTKNYETILAMACASAKGNGSPFILENHLLTALLTIPSPALDQALAYLGTCRDALCALCAMLGQVRHTSVTQTPWSQFPMPS